MDSGSTTAKAKASAPSLGQVARERLPMVQNTRSCNASAVATNCSKDTSALKLNTSAMPNSTTPVALMPPQRATRSSSKAEAIANTKALAGTAQDAGTPGRLQSSTIASAAPKAAADDSPKVKGLASGLASTVCISAPARPSARPTATAIKA